MTLRATQSSVDLSRHSVELARQMIEVHGAAAADVARDNARAAALAGQAIQARNWLRTLDVIQHMIQP